MYNKKQCPVMSLLQLIDSKTVPLILTKVVEIVFRSINTILNNRFNHIRKHTEFYVYNHYNPIRIVDLGRIRSQTEVHRYRLAREPR